MNDNDISSAMSLSNCAITASAGCGKTEELVRRLIALLALGAAPEDITTMTFTRAAAGEMFDRLLQRLSAAATSDRDAAKIINDIIAMLDKLTSHGAFCPQEVAEAITALDRNRFQQMLRQVIDKMHSVHIGTLDSYFSKIVGAFPLELDVPADYEIMDEYAAACQRDAILRELLSRPGIEKRAGEHFTRTFKQIVVKSQKKRVFDIIQNEIIGLKRYLHASPERVKWGDARQIWNGENAWTPPSIDDINQAWRICQAWFEQKDIHCKLEPMLQFLKTMNADSGWTTDNKKNFRVLVDSLEALREGSDKPAIKGFIKSFEYTAEVSRAIARLVENGLHFWFEQTCRQTEGIYEIISQYDRQYCERSVRQGKIGFDDLIRLLMPDEERDNAAKLDWKQYIAFRMNGKTRHWALDEFQDTSRAQWSVLGNIIDDVWSGENDTSFFMVGDVKQAIYGWRGGDSSLMTELITDNQLPVIPLNKTFRFGQAIVDAVNDVFGHLDHNATLPQRVTERWMDEKCWQSHEAAMDRPGCCAVFQAGKTTISYSDEFFAVIEAILKKIRPWEKNLSAAVLVRNNKAGKELVRYLHDHGIAQVIWEGEQSIAEEPLISAMLSLLLLLQHPEDRYAREQVLMGPLRPLLPWSPERSWNQEKYGMMVGSFDHEGFHLTLKKWLAQLTLFTPGFTALADSNPVRNLLAAASAFDASGQHDVCDFQEYVRKFEVQDIEAGNNVRVMTIHHSKGLGFDMTIVPLPSKQDSMTRPDYNKMICNGSAHSPSWLINSPDSVGAADKAIENAAMETLYREVFEDICNCYVSMTRAKHGLYVLVPPLPKESNKPRETYYLSDFIREGIGDTPRKEAPWLMPAEFAEPIEQYELLSLYGNPEWYEQNRVEAALLAIPPITFATIPGASNTARMKRLRPSQQDTGKFKTWLLFEPRHDSGTELGNAVHEFLSRIEWLDDFSIRTVPAEIQPHFDQCLRNPQISKMLNRPNSARYELWKERSFEVIITNKGQPSWVSGAFDRVTVEYDAAERVSRVVLLDYKTNQVSAESLDELVKHYRPQMDVYRQALSKLLNVDHLKIEAYLIFTRIGKLCPVA